MQSPPSYEVAVSTCQVVPCARKANYVEQPKPAAQPSHAEKPIYSMGFDRLLVESALQQFNGDEQQAVEALLSGRLSHATVSPKPPVMHDRPAPHDAPQPQHSDQHADARRHLLNTERACDIREQLYCVLPGPARKAGWDTPSIQSALDLPSLGFTEGSAGERAVRLFDAIASGKLSLQQLQQAEVAQIAALAQEN
jgi:hypothetical protein